MLDLENIERRAEAFGRNVTAKGNVTAASFVGHDIPALIAEVRRLAALVVRMRWEESEGGVTHLSDATRDAVTEARAYLRG